MKRFKLLALLILGVMAWPRVAGAVDLTVTCANHAQPCETTPGGMAPLFYETNLLPGDTVMRTLTVINEDREEACSLSMLNLYNQTQSPSDFATRLFTVIRSGGISLYGGYAVGMATSLKTIDDMYNETPIDLAAVVPPGGVKIFDWYATFDINAGNEYQHAETVFDFELLFACGVEEEGPVLTLSKTNDTGGVAQAPGGAVMFTLVLTNGDTPLTNVVVTDLPHDGFIYRPGSYTGILTEPNYASPGEWLVGNMDPFEVVTLTYVADIDGAQEPGLYPDLAWAKGEYGESIEVLANANAGLFVGTEVRVSGDGEMGANYELPNVLGASTELPATGADIKWLILAFTGLVLGMGMVVLGFRMRRPKNA